MVYILTEFNRIWYFLMLAIARKTGRDFIIQPRPPHTITNVSKLRQACARTWIKLFIIVVFIHHALLINYARIGYVLMPTGLQLAVFVHTGFNALIVVPLSR